MFSSLKSSLRNKSHRNEKNEETTEDEEIDQFLRENQDQDEGNGNGNGDGEDSKPSASHDDITVPRTNFPKKEKSKSVTLNTPEDSKEVKRLRKEIHKEKSAKRKLYKSLVKMANELKSAQENKTTAKPCPSPWYEGGMWRAPELLPSVQDKVSGNDPVSLSDMFFDLVTVTAFTRVGVAIQERGELHGSSLAYFAVFWLIWGKEASYSTRFDTTDLSSQASTLVTCIAILLGSLSTNARFDEDECTRIMKMAAFVSLLHLLLHLRVYHWFRDTPESSNLLAVREYAILIMIMTFLENITWIVGIYFVSPSYRYIVFIIGILFSLRIPRSFLQNDFHAACSKRGVLFIMLLGFVLQNVVLVATPFFKFSAPTFEQNLFLVLALLLLFCIKLLYVDDSSSCMMSSDHALLVSRAAGFLYHVGQFALLLSTTTLGAGLNLLTKSYLAATEALPEDAQMLVCAGFSGVIASIAFIKSLHIRRVPIEEAHKMLFYAAFAVQSIVVIAIVIISASMCITRGGVIGYLVMNDIEMLGVLVGFSFFLLLASWLDTGIELSLYGGSSFPDDDNDGNVSNTRNYRVHPFGIWFCFKPGEPDSPVMVKNPFDLSEREKMRHLSPLISASQRNLFGSGSYGSLQGAAASDGNGHEVV